MSGNSALQRVEERGWRRGLDNLLGAGFAAWFKTNTWWIHALIWTGVLNGLLAAILFGGAEIDVLEGVDLFFVFAGLFPPVAVIIIMQGEIVGEKQSGTAAWILSKPVSRAAFVLSKLLPNAVGAATTMAVLPACGAYLLLSIASGGPLAPLRYAGGASMLVLNLFFYLSLTVMLGVLFDKRGGVIAIPLGLAFGQQYILGMIPAAVHVLPWTLTVPLGDDIRSLAGSIALGQPLHSWGPIASVGAASLICIAVALWRFERQEL